MKQVVGLEEEQEVNAPNAASVLHITLLGKPSEVSWKYNLRPWQSLRWLSLWHSVATSPNVLVNMGVWCDVRGGGWQHHRRLPQGTSRADLLLHETALN